jgi:hypothetical protein
MFPFVVLNFAYNPSCMLFFFYEGTKIRMIFELRFTNYGFLETTNRVLQKIVQPEHKYRAKTES